MTTTRTELYFCKTCSAEIDRHLFEHWLAVHNHKAGKSTPIYDYYDADPTEQQQYYLWSHDNIEFSRSVSLEEEQVKALSKFDDKHVSSNKNNSSNSVFYLYLNQY
jgi:hypothetical protein